LNPSNELGYFGINSRFMWKTTPASKGRDSCLHPMIVDETDERASRVSLQPTNQPTNQSAILELNLLN